MQNADYTEWVPAGALVKGLFVLVSLIVVFVTFAVFLFSEAMVVEDIFGVGFAWVVLAFLLFVFWNYRGLRIQISQGRLTVTYGVFNKKSFQLKDIGSCKIAKANFGRYWGIGVRYGSDGSIAYTTSFGDAVEVAPKRGRVFVFSSQRSDQVCKIIKENSLEK